MIRFVAAIGASVLNAIAELGAIARFGGSIVVTCLKPPYRGGLFVDELLKSGVMSLLIIGVSGVAVGMVLGLQGYNTLVRFGAEESLGAVVGLTIIRELGPVLTALLTTGRAGSATTAEIGTMVATSQLDGLRMMSVSPMDYVVRPRAFALFLVMPLLSALFITASIFGGYLVGVGLMGIDAGTYTTGLIQSVTFRDDIAGSLLKSLVFGALVGLISTYRGYHAKPTSVGVSSATTSTVVTASVAILITDYFITALWGV
ncbi:MAG: phospholipid/cholesterol/gamma-HCH transport system permease protein [Hyphomicrobiaceae bacterium]|jgi:phospholipid/cholesterol/gamma-HCH transport system permease protein